MAGLAPPLAPGAPLRFGQMHWREELHPHFRPPELRERWGQAREIGARQTIDIHRQQALKAGVTEQELAEAVHVAAALRAGGAITHGTHLFK